MEAFALNQQVFKLIDRAAYDRLIDTPGEPKMEVGAVCAPVL
jgi:hypothetical protein